MKRELVLFGIITIFLTPIFAETLGRHKMVIYQTQEKVMFSEEITPYADSIVTKCKLINAKLYYRRWNETKEYWIDSDWIPYNSYALYES
ncbi:MAG: hypothetical protein K2H91_00490 [Lachnospiraceae bacterium]|nr:hypothetical protein [Lachnospiraceae bacterium]